MEIESDYTIKLLVLGDSNVGKTNYILKFIENKFDNCYMSTTGIDLKSSNLVIKDKKIKLQLWDTAGQEKYNAITKNLFLKVQGIIIMYDITSENSFISLKKWVNSIKEECGQNMQKIMVGNKCDLNWERAVRKERALQYSNEEKIDYIETSSKTGENIRASIIKLCEKVLDNTEIGEDFSFTLDVSSHKKRNKGVCC